ncbi:MAG TPA: ABC transporter permease [Microbacteriaceae bacterium]|nr:ABC transporter permease [Microbacteriaceae bacterium]
MGLKNTAPPLRITPRRLAPVMYGLIGFAALFLILEVTGALAGVNRLYLPSVTESLATAVQLVVNPVFLANVGATLHAWIVGLAIAFVLGVPLGIVLGSWSRAYRASTILIEYLRPIPSVALIPLVILIFGTSLEMRASLVVYATIWPILFNTVYGVHDVEPLLKDSARVFGYSRFEILFRVSLPSALPYIYSGLRIATSIGLIVCISAELLAGGGQGVGSWLFNIRASGSPAVMMYAGTLLVGVLGVIINLLMEWIERRFIGWQPALRGSRS